MAAVDVVVVGSYVQDHAWRTAQFPAVGETRIGTFSTGPGGKGFNQAVACHKQGVSTRFLGAVGADRPMAGKVCQSAGHHHRPVHTQRSTTLRQFDRQFFETRFMAH